MTLAQSVVDQLAARNVPVLCIDTCSVLDLLRDVTRDSISPANVRSGLALLRCAEETEELVVLIAEQVSREIADHVQDTEDTSGAALSRFLAQAQRIHEVAVALGAEGELEIAHIEGHTTRARLAFDRWETVATAIPQNAELLARAWHRVQTNRSPAKRGKDSTKDCIVIEAYLEVAANLRALGMTAPIVFVSSNTKEYIAPGTSRIPEDLDVDFSTVGLTYAPNFSAAAYSLGLRRILPS